MFKKSLLALTLTSVLLSGCGEKQDREFRGDAAKAYTAIVNATEKGIGNLDDYENFKRKYLQGSSENLSKEDFALLSDMNGLNIDAMAYRLLPNDEEAKQTYEQKKAEMESKYGLY